MSTGTIKWFAQGLLDLGNKIHNLSSDTLKLGIVTAGGRTDDRTISLKIVER
jgi:hypothetical protein